MSRKRAPLLGLLAASAIVPAVAGAALLGRSMASDASPQDQGRAIVGSCAAPEPVPLAPLAPLVPLELGEPGAAARLAPSAAEPRVHVERSDPAAEPPETDSLRAFARTLHAPGASLEEPCLEAESDDDGCACAGSVLEPFWSALDQSRARGRRTGVIVFGNSLIASDGIISVVRRRLVERFGDGGPGLLLADRMASYGPRDRTAAAADGWFPETVANIPAPRTLPVGLAGVHHVSDGPAWTRFRLPKATSSATLYWLDRAAGPALEWRVEGGGWRPLRADQNDAPRASLLVVEAATKKRRPSFLEVRARGPGAVIQGLALEHEAGGIVVDTLGVPSADATLWLDADAEIFARQLAARSPSLVVAMLGGNEVRRLAWGRSSRAQVAESLRSLLRRLKDASQAACLVIGPLDAVKGPPDAAQDGGDANDAKTLAAAAASDGVGADAFVPRPQLDDIIEIERRVALEEGCAFFDLYAAMGGRGSLKRFHEAHVLHDDLSHPRGRGLDVLGQLVADALLEAYAASTPPARDDRSLLARTP